jgi:hypothetical protein
LKTKIEIIEETVAYYSENPRSVKYGSLSKCVYLNENGNKCAFSRCCTDEGVTWLHEQIDVIEEGDSVIQHFLKHLKPEYQGHDFEFWKDIQRLHDNKGYWVNGNGKLNERGETCVNWLKNKYK